MPFDVGRIVRDVQGEFDLFCATREECETKSNTATPEHLAVLLASLRAVTDAADDEGGLAGTTAFFALAQWRRRLDAYDAFVSAAAPGDRVAVLWTVTAPLLLGFYGGPESDEPQRVADVATPFILANASEISEAWRNERRRMFFNDLERGAREIADDITSPIGVPLWVWGAGALGLFLLLRR
jgi:hypothetical protein